MPPSTQTHTMEYLGVKSKGSFSPTMSGWGWVFCTFESPGPQTALVMQSASARVFLVQQRKKPQCESLHFLSSFPHCLLPLPWKNSNGTPNPNCTRHLGQSSYLRPKAGVSLAKPSAGTITFLHGRPHGICESENWALGSETWGGET